MKGLYTFTLHGIQGHAKANCAKNHIQEFHRFFISIPYLASVYTFWGELTAILLYEMMASFSFYSLLLLHQLSMVLNQINGVAGDSGKIKHLIPVLATFYQAFVLLSTILGNSTNLLLANEIN